MVRWDIFMVNGIHKHFGWLMMVNEYIKHYLWDVPMVHNG